MAEESNIINIATLTINSEGVVKSIEETKKELFSLQKANSDLRKEITKTGDPTGELTKQFVANDIAIKNLNATYKQQQTALNELTLAEVENSNALKTNAKSVGEAVQQTKALKVMRDQIDASTTDGAKAVELLNKKIDDNNKFINTNTSEIEKQKNNVGNYKSALEGANGILSKYGLNIGEVHKTVVGFGRQVNDVQDKVVSMAGSMATSARSMIGFKTATEAQTETQIAQTVATEAQTVAAGVATGATEAQAGASVTATAATEGLAVAEGTATAATGGLSTAVGILLLPLTVLVGVGLLVYNLFKNFAPVINPIKDAFAGLVAAVTVVKSTLTGLLSGNLSLSESFGSLGSDMADAAKEAAALNAEFRKLAKAQDLQDIANAKTKTAVQGLILQSKDRTKTEKERIDLINQAQKLEEDNSKANLALIGRQIVAQKAKVMEGKKFTEEEIADINKRGYAALRDLVGKKALDKEELAALKELNLKKEAAKQESQNVQEKAQNRENVLAEKADQEAEKRAQKADDDAKKALESIVKSKEAEIAAAKERNAALDNSSAERLQFIKDVGVKELELLQFKKSKGLITEAEYTLGVLNLKKSQSAQTLQIAEDSISKELEAQQKQVEANKTITEFEKNEAILNADLLKEIEVKRIEGSLLSEADKAKALLEINTGYLAAVAQINTQFTEAEKVRKETALREEETLRTAAQEIRILNLQEQGATELEIQRAQLDAAHANTLDALDADLAAKRKTAEEVRALKELEDKKYAGATKKLDKEVGDAKKSMQLGMVKNAVAAASAIFGDSKEVAIASALINTYEGISAGVKLGYPAAIPAVAAAAATGFAAVKNILKTDKGTKDGGSSGSNFSNAGATFTNPAKTQVVAQVQTAPPQTPTPTVQPVLVLEHLDEVKDQQQIKIKSGG